LTLSGITQSHIYFAADSASVAFRAEIDNKSRGGNKTFWKQWGWLTSRVGHEGFKNAAYREKNQPSVHVSFGVSSDVDIDFDRFWAHPGNFLGFVAHVVFEVGLHVTNPVNLADAIRGRGIALNHCDCPTPSPTESTSSC
jgi:hypothetical protein